MGAHRRGRGERGRDGVELPGGERRRGQAHPRRGRLHRRSGHRRGAVVERSRDDSRRECPPIGQHLHQSQSLRAQAGLEQSVRPPSKRQQHRIRSAGGPGLRRRLVRGRHGAVHRRRGPGGHRRRQERAPRAEPDRRAHGGARRGARAARLRRVVPLRRRGVCRRTHLPLARRGGQLAWFQRRRPAAFAHERAGEPRADGGAGDCGDGAGGRDADRAHARAARWRRPLGRDVHLPVGAHRRRERGGDYRGDVADLHAVHDGRGQAGQGVGVLHRRLRHRRGGGRERDLPGHGDDRAGAGGPGGPERRALGGAPRRALPPPGTGGSRARPPRPRGRSRRRWRTRRTRATCSRRRSRS